MYERLSELDRVRATVAYANDLAVIIEGDSRAVERLTP